MLIASVKPERRTRVNVFPATLARLVLRSLARLSRFAFSSAADNKADPTSCKVVLASMVAKDLLTGVSKGLLRLGETQLLVGFLANTDPAARKYAEWTDRTFREK